jgi:FtsZ-binding cell division protein ZapB
MKKDLSLQNSKVQNDISGLNNKLDNVLDTVHQLKSSYNDLKQDNINLHKQLSQLQGKIDQLENQSRRNNLRFTGISGVINEKWELTEQKLRDFLRNGLKFGEQADNFDIERAHRVKSNNTDACTIIARFTRYKDTQIIMDRANSVYKSTRDRSVLVQQDYSDRIKRHRRILGEKMVQDRQKGHYAVLRYDKLFVNDSIYRYDDHNECIVFVGNRQRGTQTRVQSQHEQVNTGNVSRLVTNQAGRSETQPRDVSADLRQPITSTRQTSQDEYLSDSTIE